MSDSPSTDIVIPSAAPSGPADLQGVSPYPITYQLKATPILRPPPSKRPRLLSCLRRLPLVRKMVALKEKLPLVGKKKPVPGGEWGGGPIATAPIAGAKKDIPPRVQPVAIVPGTWNEEAATLVLLEVRCPAKPAVPEAVVTVQVTGIEDNHPRPPIVIGWGPESVTSETQELEHTRELEGGGHAGAKAVFGEAGIDGKATNKEVQHDTVQGSFVAAPVELPSGEYGGVTFQLTQVRGSKHGLPTWVRLAVVYKYDGPADFHVELNVLGTIRRFNFKSNDNQDLALERSFEYPKPGQPCTSCAANGTDETCHDFAHSDAQFWFSLLNTRNLSRPNSLPLPPGRNVSDLAIHTSDADIRIWFATFRREAGAVPEAEAAQ